MWDCHACKNADEQFSLQRFLDTGLADASSKILGLATEKNDVCCLHGTDILALKDRDQ